MVTRTEVIAAIRSLLPAFERHGEHVRLVGTASSLLRGIELPAGDVDVLARSRTVVDDLARSADGTGATCIAAPRWIDTPFGGQYIAEYDVDGVRVELSTVELGTPDPGAIAECAGEAPWRHFDVVDIEGCALPLVASELRLLSEVTRGRDDRWRPIASFLSEHGYDDHLLRAALVDVPSDVAAEVHEVLGRRLS